MIRFGRSLAVCAAVVVASPAAAQEFGFSARHQKEVARNGQPVEMYVAVSASHAGYTEAELREAVRATLEGRGYEVRDAGYRAQVRDLKATSVPQAGRLDLALRGGEVRTRGTYTCLDTPAPKNVGQIGPPQQEHYVRDVVVTREHTRVEGNVELARLLLREVDQMGAALAARLERVCREQDALRR